MTPKSVDLQIENVRSVSRSRKQLKLQQSPAKTVAFSKSKISYPTCLPAKPSISNIPEDHGYSSKSLDTQTIDQSHLISDLKALLKGATSCEDDISKKLQEVRLESASLTSRTASYGSVLYKYRDKSRLEENADHFLDEIIEEMIQRVPFLLKVLLCVAVPANENMKQSISPAIASAYSILMKHKYDNLSAYHRLATIIAVKGGLDERAQTRLNQLGLVLSWSARITLLDSIQATSEKLIAENLKKNPLIKVTGDNLDIYVKTSHLSKDRQHKDLHLFTSYIIFSRVATVDMSNVAACLWCTAFKNTMQNAFIQTVQETFSQSSTS